MAYEVRPVTADDIEYSNDVCMGQFGYYDGRDATLPAAVLIGRYVWRGARLEVNPLRYGTPFAFDHHVMRHEAARIRHLARRIEAGGWLSRLLVTWWPRSRFGPPGWYVANGSHRLAALQLLGAQAVPVGIMDNREPRWPRGLEP